MKIGDLDTRERVFIVAEIGNNHEGDFGRAKEMVERAVDSGADAVKFQTFLTERFQSNQDPARLARLRGFQLSFDQFAALSELTRARGVRFMSTPFDLESAVFLRTICDVLKIASGDNDYWDLVGSCAESALPLVVSTGMSTDADVARLVAFLRERRSVDAFAILHCVSAYPAPPEQANLRCIARMSAELPCTVGYSDHTLGIDACVAAVALGARVIEKHFTLSKTLSDFRDHQLSADPDDLRELVRRVRTVEVLLGSGDKTLREAEAGVIQAARRSAAAERALSAGHVLARGDLIFLRPGTGIRTGGEAAIVGRKLRRDVSAGTLLSVDDFD